MTVHSAQELLRLAFRDVRPSRERLRCKTISHEDAIKFYRRKLVTLSQEDFEYFLPRVLIELLESGKNNLDDDEGIESVMRLLNVEPPSTDVQWEEKEFGTEAAVYSA